MRTRLRLIPGGRATAATKRAVPPRQEPARPFFAFAEGRSVSVAAAPEEIAYQFCTASPHRQTGPL